MNQLKSCIKNLKNIFKKEMDRGKYPISEINRRIKGILAISVREEVWVNLKNEKFN